MGTIRLPKKVALLCSVCYSIAELKDQALDNLQLLYGPLWRASDPLTFTHTHYYEKEMGGDLKKLYVIFAEPIDPIDLAKIKHSTNALEQQWCEGGNRKINLDPGYIELAKLVLASTKNFSHRIYIGEGIYGDVQLVWQAGRFRANPWTYPDYQEKSVVTFFDTIRKEYQKKLDEDPQWE
jgi:hypothetical protein